MYVLIRIDDGGFNPDLHDVLGPFDSLAAVEQFAGACLSEDSEYLVEKVVSPIGYNERDYR